MNDDPSVKEVLAAAANIPKKVGQSLLDAKVPVSSIAGFGRFLVVHWLAGLLAIMIFGWLSFHYLSQMDETRYMCHGPKATFTLATNPSTDVKIRAAFALSPVAQGIASLTWKNDNRPDPTFNFQKFMDDNQEFLAYFQAAAVATNFDHATEIIQYERSQTIARCIADNSWLTLLVVIAQALIAYLVLLAVLPVRRGSAID